jgi:uncharacterized protein with PIN domain
MYRRGITLINKFIADAMLGSLARKLRIFGYDTLYDAKIKDSQILQFALDDNRTILTCDRDLFRSATKTNINSILLTGDNDIDKLATIFRSFRGKRKPLDPLSSRCSICNGELCSINKNEISSLIPEGVLHNQEEFYKCIICGKIFWIGIHWKKIKELSDKIDIRLQQLKESSRREYEEICNGNIR